MKLSEFIRDLQQLAGDTDPDVVLYDTNRDVQYESNPDADIWDFEAKRGDGELVIEFAGLAGAPGSTDSSEEGWRSANGEH